MLEHRVGRTAGIEMGDGKRKPCVGLYVKNRTMWSQVFALAAETPVSHIGMPGVSS